MRRDAAHPLTPRLRHAVMAIDQVVTAGGDFREDHRSRQVGRPDGSLLESLAAAKIRNVRELHETDGESFRMGADERQESCDVELEDPVRVQLIAGFGGAGLEVPIKLKLRRLLNRLRGAKIRSIVPGAEECISYRIPAFRLNGSWSPVSAQPPRAARISHSAGRRSRPSLAIPVAMTRPRVRSISRRKSLYRLLWCAN